MTRRSFPGILSSDCERLNVLEVWLCVFFRNIKGVIVRYRGGTSFFFGAPWLLGGDLINKMTSDLTTYPKETETALAHDLHRTLLKIFLSKGSQLSGALTSQEINKLLREYAYRGSDIKYVSK